MVECELTYHKSIFADSKSFNRYMVECEFFIIKTVIHFFTSFNRYMVECELNAYQGYTLQAVVLIDTWWNVNTLLHEPMFRTGHVLIDTWWNVNVYQFIIFKIDFAF